MEERPDPGSADLPQSERSHYKSDSNLALVRSIGGVLGSIFGRDRWCLHLGLLGHGCTYYAAHYGPQHRLCHGQDRSSLSDLIYLCGALRRLEHGHMQTFRAYLFYTDFEV